MSDYYSSDEDERDPDDRPPVFGRERDAWDAVTKTSAAPKNELKDVTKDFGTMAEDVMGGDSGSDEDEMMRKKNHR
jgi:hypothetical protein